MLIANINNNIRLYISHFLLVKNLMNSFVYNLFIFQKNKCPLEKPFRLFLPRIQSKNLTKTTKNLRKRPLKSLLQNKMAS
jgi:hypothetical protein